MVYGFEAMEIDSTHILLFKEMMQLGDYTVIGGWLVDFFLSCKSLIMLSKMLSHPFM